MRDKQLAGLGEASLKKKLEARAKTDKAIALLVKNNQKITIRSVAREAEVSVSYIYKYPELAYEIQRLREQQKYSLVVAPKKLVTKTKEAEILRQKNIELTDKVAELEAIIERVRSGKNTVKSLKEENIRLATESVRLEKELKYALKNLQSAREFILEQETVYPSPERTKRII